MRVVIWALLMGTISITAYSQSFTLVSSTTFSPAFSGGAFRGLSGIEYVPGAGWYVVSDRGGRKEQVNKGNVFLAPVMPPTTDDVQLLTPQAVPSSLECIRYDAAHDLFFLSGERDSVAAGEHDSTAILLLKNRDLSRPELAVALLQQASEVDNKGIEGLAITPSGHLWAVPEAGWPGETALDQPTVHIRRYKSPLASRTFEAFSYPIDRFPNAFNELDRHGGIAELLAVNDTTLLVLERGYHNFLLKEGTKKEVVLGRIYRVTINEASHTLTKTIAFDFNKPAQFADTARNLEGMSWGPPGPTGKRRLYLIADDNFEDQPDRQTTQRNQWIVLEEN